MAGPANIRDVAAMAGVSVATVSRTLKNPDLVRPATREEVLRCVAALGFVPNAQARHFRRQATDTVILLVRNISNPFYLDVFKGVEDVAAIMRGAVDDASWSVSPGTAHTGPVPGRHPVNYPGDIKLGWAGEGAVAYFANRGYDTVSAFSLDGDALRLIGEVASGTQWPQHLLVTASELLVAGWDTGTVVAIPLENGRPGEPRVLFEVSGAGWLLPS